MLLLEVKLQQFELFQIRFMYFDDGDDDELFVSNFGHYSLTLDFFFLGDIEHVIIYASELIRFRENIYHLFEVGNASQTLEM